LLVGTSSSLADSLFQPTLQIVKASSVSTEQGLAGLFLYPGTSAARGPRFSFNRSRGSSAGSNTLVASGDLLGDIFFTGADGTNFVSAASIAASVDGTSSTNAMPGRLTFATTAAGASSPTERMRITSAGTASFNDGNNNIGSTKRLIHLGMNGTTEWGIVARMKTSAGITVLRNYNDSGTYVGGITASTTATTFATSSDYRLKENVVPLTGAADRLKLIPVHRFNFIADPDTTVDGFIAHEAQAVVPECATGTKDEVDADGKPVYQGIDQSKLVPLLTAALQEALTEIESLKARVTALEP
jgi:hypothetical protein